MDLATENNCSYYRDETSLQHSMNQNMVATTCARRRDQPSPVISSGLVSSQDTFGGVVKIVPSDVDVSIDQIKSNVEEQ